MKEKSQEWWILIVGNVVNGLEFYGPFSQDQAFEKGEEFSTEDWHIAPLK